mmetsp:Transcript_58596/g.156655  ORF Transcript_58596/g.156655 Transcript_58596/m.156655 type:complete len:235 (-) Transcript_58596:124-828(-)
MDVLALQHFVTLTYRSSGLLDRIAQSLAISTRQHLEPVLTCHTDTVFARGTLGASRRTAYSCCRNTSHTFLLPLSIGSAKDGTWDNRVSVAPWHKLAPIRNRFNSRQSLLVRAENNTAAIDHSRNSTAARSNALVLVVLAGLETRLAKTLSLSRADLVALTVVSVTPHRPLRHSKSIQSKTCARSLTHTKLQIKTARDIEFELDQLNIDHAGPRKAMYAFHGSSMHKTEAHVLV